jgi:hypothetical protein
MAKKSLKQAVEEIKKEVVAEIVPAQEIKPCSIDYIKQVEKEIRANFAVRPISTVSQKNSFASALAMDLYKKGLLRV